MQHLNPKGKSMLGALLQNRTQMEVLNADDEVEVNRIAFLSILPERTSVSSTGFFN